ncbi:synaptic vesicle glycoprotein 2C-like [Ornithodoros turicata]|uniref:synaptic vesicle glycoprotein 2C-like n=1 Tax=Ornithodoros turicata TaxID=34597 RepID=UPI00313A4034
MKGDDESESVSLVARESVPGSYTEDQRGVSAALRETDYVDANVPLLSQFHEDAIAQAGEGLFQWLVFLVCGLCLAADAIEIFAIAYVLPSAERELCMDDSRKAWLGGISFVGMMIGGLLWGNLADKMGRRRILLSALLTNTIFSVITTFMPTYGLFMVTRLCSGLGVGGSIPIAFTYFAEFLLKKHRGRNLCWLLLFWAIGGVFAAVMAWGLIPRTGMVLLDLGRLHFSSWRLFLLVCAAPSLLSVFGLMFLPESPRFLLEVGRDVEAMFVYQQIFKMNHTNKPAAEYQLTELELPGRRAFHGIPPAANRTLISDFCFSLESFWSSFFQIFCSPFMKITFILLVVWFTTSFGLYGMGIWFPEYLKQLQVESYTADMTFETNHNVHNYVFNYSIENTHFEDCVFRNVRFSGIVLNHVLFSNCTFFNSTFSDVRSSRSLFSSCDFHRVKFVDTDFYESRFDNCDFSNSTTFLNRRTGCPIDFDINFQLSDVFVQNLFAQLAIIPGNIISSCVIDRFGRVRTLGISMFLTCGSVLLVWLANSRPSVITFQAIFNFVSISAWNAVDVITTESYPATLRSTAYGFLSATSRLASLLGVVSFGHLLEISKAAPILTTAGVILLGSLFSMKIPETKDVLM